MNASVPHMVALLRQSVETYATDWDMDALIRRQDALWAAAKALGISDDVMRAISA